MTSTYDRIARFYDVDMAQNMRFDDVAFYAHQCARQPGRVLEIGCGNGRILLPLAARGIDITGVDASQAMLADLARKARMRGIVPRILRADARRMPLRPVFATALIPYSLVTYMTTAGDAAALLAAARAALLPGGRLVLDAFVPRPVLSRSEFSEDYRRPFGVLTLIRAKRITALADATNRIERRYELANADGRVVERLDVTEVIRPCTPSMLRDAVRAADMVPVDEAFDYGTRPDAVDAQFFTLVARVPR